MNNKTIVIFGAFDNIHDGHLHLIREAKKLGDRLVVIVARDSIILAMKGKSPLNDEVSRINSLLEVEEVDTVLLGDIENSTYFTIKEVNPDIICFGYDQTSFHEDIESAIKKGLLPLMKLVYASSYMPETHHSSLLNK